MSLIWMAQNLIDDKLTLVQVMAWCRQQMLTQIYVSLESTSFNLFVLVLKH